MAESKSEKITIIKTGQILIEETDLGNDECIRTEYEIEEIQIEAEPTAAADEEEEWKKNVLADFINF